MKDPYKVLGIPRSATDEEVKKAYRNLARKYHPDNFAGSAQAAGSEEIMKEINEAYDTIQKERQGRQTGGGSHYNTYTSSGTTSFYEVRRLINEGRYSEAELIIDSTPASDRGAEWNYLKGALLANRGYYYDAQKHIETACYLDPQNAEYQDARNKLRYQSGSYGGSYRGQGSGSSDCCSICATFMVLDACCDCCGAGC